MANLLFYGGIAFMSCAAIGAAVTIMVSRITNRRLQTQFDIEFGKNRTDEGE